MRGMAPVFLGFVLALGSLGACESSSAFTAVYLRAGNQKLPFIDRQQAFERIIQECPDDSRLYGELASLFISHLKFDTALVWIDKGLKLSPENSDLRVQKGTALLPLGRPREALAVLNSISTPEASFYRAMAYRLLQDHSNSRNSFLNAWELGYKSAYVLYSIIQEDYSLGDKRGGLDHFQLLLRTYPDSPWVHLLLADAYFAKEQNDEARGEYLKALTAKPDILEANFRLGYMAFQAGDKKSAARYFRQEVSLNPTYVDARVFLAEALLQLDNKKEALVQLRAALKLDQNSDLTYKRLATTLIETNQLNEATKTLKNAERRFPKDPAFPAQLARVFTLLNRTRDAQEEAGRVRQLMAEQHHGQEIAPAK